MNRPQSRGSTASARSTSTQPNVDQNFDNAGFGDTRWNGNGNGHRNHGGNLHSSMTTEQVQQVQMLRPGSHTPSSHGFSMDSSTTFSVGQSMSFQPLNQHQRQSLPTNQGSVSNSFAGQDSQVIERESNVGGDSGLGALAAPKTSRSSANNEAEMRHLFEQNRSRSLKDVAQELFGNDRGPTSERSRQIFAMLWINQSCTTAKTSVPRGRVYANYAQRCALERVTVLNPASFGKLVRVLFPGLKTRRLGVRGESKYHYVNFDLVHDDQEAKESKSPFESAPSIPGSFTTKPGASSAPTAPRTAEIPVQPPSHPLTVDPTVSRSYQVRHAVYDEPTMNCLDAPSASMSKTPRKLCFKPMTEPSDPSAPLIMPDIEPYLPQGADPDVAKQLVACYLSHCTSLVESIRYCKEINFFYQYTAFSGTLTTPVSRLFAHTDLAPWIEGCDFVTYHRMTSIISSLTGKVLPQKILNTISKISTKLVSHIRQTFQDQPKHVREAKEAPAVIFAALLDRALRVNSVAHNTARWLSRRETRDQMYSDWIDMVCVRKVAECVPARGMDDVLHLLLNEMRGLLIPSIEEDSDDAVRALGRFTNLLESLSSKFPYASAADIVWCVQGVGTHALRDITMKGGESFQSWWATKCYIDEMICFLAERGGFMTTTSIPRPKEHDAMELQASTGDCVRRQSQYSSASDGFHMPLIGQSQSDHAPFSQESANNNHDVLSLDDTMHDDSGIGIRTPEEEPLEEKYNLSD